MDQKQSDSLGIRVVLIRFFGRSGSTKVGRVLPMAISSIFRLRQYSDEDHRVEGTHFRIAWTGRKTKNSTDE